MVISLPVPVICKLPWLLSRLTFTVIGPSEFKLTPEEIVSPSTEVLVMTTRTPLRLRVVLWIPDEAKVIAPDPDGVKLIEPLPEPEMVAELLSGPMIIRS